MSYKFDSKKDVYRALDEIVSGSLFGDEYMSHEEILELVDAVREFVSGAIDRPTFNPFDGKCGGECYESKCYEAMIDLCAAGRALYDAYGVICPEVDAYILMALRRVDDALDIINADDLKAVRDGVKK